MNKVTKRRRNQEDRRLHPTNNRRHHNHHHHHHHHNHHHHHHQHQQPDDDYIPLPIQTFLWRQTSPFVRPFLGKARDLAQIEQRDACKLFERIIITNNIWGQSPSLTDAIASVDRWRIIKVSFPFVLQCTAALLNNKLIKDHNFNRLGGNEAKMMYTLQWILMNASEECADSENEAKSNANTVAFAAASLLKPSSNSEQTNIASSAGQQAPTQASATQQLQVVVAAGSGNTSQLNNTQQAEHHHQQQGLLPGPTNQSIVIPAAAAVVAIGQPAGLSSLKGPVIGRGEVDQQQPADQQQQQPAPNSSSSVSPIGSSTPTQAATTSQLAAGPSGQSVAVVAAAMANQTQLMDQLPSWQMENKFLLPVSSIQMFVYYFGPIMDGLKHSDFLSSNQRLEIGAALWEPLFNHQLPDIHCLRARIRRDLSDDDDLDNQRQQVGGSSLPSASLQQAAGAKGSGAKATGGNDQMQPTVSQQPLGHDRRRSSSMFNDSAHFGDVFLGGPTVVNTGGSSPDDPANNRLGALSSHMEQSMALTKTSLATYLDVAVLRCLFVTDWQEPGVFWAINYLANRFNEQLYTSNETGSSGSSSSGDSSDFNSTSDTDGQDDEDDRENRHQFSSRLPPGADKRRYRRRRSKSSGKPQRRSRSLSRVSGEDLRRSLALRREHLKQQKSPACKNQNASAPIAVPVADSNVASPQIEQQIGSQGGGQSQFLQVTDKSSGGGDQEQVNKSPVRRLSFSSGMQTLANQIRKTSRRVKRAGQDSREPSGDSLSQTGSQLNISSTAPDQSRLSRHRRSSSADELSNSQLAALTQIDQHQQTAMATERTQTEQLEGSVDLRPMITVTTGGDSTSTKGQAKDQNEQEEARQYLVQSLYLKSLRHFQQLTRSQSIPDNMRLNASMPSTRYYPPGSEGGGGNPALDKSESLGADFYVDDQGRIEPLVVLKILHSISQRESACSLRVCDRLLFLMNRLISIGILNSSRTRRRSSTLANWSFHEGLEEPRADLLPTRRQHEFNLLHRIVLLPAGGSRQRRDSQQLNSGKPQDAARHELVHKVLIDIVFRLHNHLGCPNHCGAPSNVDSLHKLAQQQQQQAFRAKVSSFSGNRQSLQQSQQQQQQQQPTDASRDANFNRSLRLSLRSSLEYLSEFNRTSFTRYVQDVFTGRNLQHVIGILHGLLGFCRPDYLAYLEQHNSKAKTSSGKQSTGGDLGENKQLLQKRRKSLGKLGTSSREPVESLIVTNSFKQLITRMATMNKEFKMAQNTALYCDVRRLINFIRENYNSTFRSIVLSALIDCTKLLNKQQQLELAHNEVEAKHRIHLQHIRQRTTATRPSSEEDSLGGVGTGLTGARHQVVASTDDELGVIDSRVGFSEVNRGPKGSSHHNASIGSPIQQQTSSLDRNQEQASQSVGILSLSKAKKKLEQVFGGVASGQQQQQQQTSEASAQPAALNQVASDDLTSPRASLNTDQSIGPSDQHYHQQQTQASFVGLNQPALSVQLIKQNQLIYETVQVGMSNFAFLMESCLPGDFLDPALLAALLDLKSPIAIRAAVFLECANFVHRCNRGQWPSWMRMSLVGGQQRSSNAGLQVGGGAAAAQNVVKMRKSSSVQRTARNNTLMYRAAGRAFYAWAEAVGARLEELLTSSEEQSSDAASSIESLLSQELDFLQPTLNGDSSPFVLKMAACQLLFEVTTFLRETYRYLPPTIVQHQIVGTGKSGDKMSSIYDVSRAVTANRRWSMALSSLGFGQLPATLSALTGQQQTQQPSSSQQVSRLANPSQTGLGSGEQQEQRRISFILHETKDTDQIREEEEEEIEQGESGDNQRRLKRDSIVGDSAADSQQEMRRITSGSTRHLSQSSASSAVVVAAATLLRSSGGLDSSAHRRKSIKLRKTSAIQDKEKQEKKAKFGAAAVAAVSAAAAAAAAAATGTQVTAGDFDEELENSSLTSDTGFRRSDSMRSRRRVSGISESSASGVAQSLLAGNQATAGEPLASGAPLSVAASSGAQAEQLSGNESAGNGSQTGGAPDEQPATAVAGTTAAAGGNSGSTSFGESSLGKLEQDEGKIMSHMPWFSAISLVNASIDCECTHFPTCQPSCYKLHQNLSKRLISFVQTIYQDPTEQKYLSSLFEKRLANLISDQQKHHNRHKQQKSSSNQAGSSKQSGDDRKAGVFRASSDCSGAESGEPSASYLTSGDRKVSKRKDKKSKKARSNFESDLDQHKTSGEMSSKPSRVPQSTMMIGGGSATSHFGHASGVKLQPSSLVDDTINILRAAKAKEKTHGEEPPMIKYLRSNVRNLLHCPMSSFLKGAIILPRDTFAEMVKFSWNLLLEDNQQLSRTAAVCFIVSAIKCPNEASKLLIDELESSDASRKLAAINKFYVVWDARYQCWPRLEDGAFVHFKMAPPSIEFTLPSPKIAQESGPVVDPPWMPRKTSNVEEVTIGQDQTVQKSFVTATKTRRKQQIELVTKALREKHDKLREDRENYNITSVPITLYAAFEPTLGGGQGGVGGMAGQGGGGGGGLDGELDGSVAGGSGGVSGGGAGGTGTSTITADEEAQQENRALFQMKTAQALFPTCLCQSAIVMINLLDDSRVTYEGSAVYEIANKVIWSCLVEDPALFLRYFFERLTRQNQSTIFQVLRRLIRFMPRLPPQAAYTLYNYLIGFIIYYIRCPFENSQKLISDTLSVLCLVVPSVHGLFLKDLKQILRKEQCDHNLLITANVPSAKKIIIHGSDSSGIPSQFPIDESTQFYHVLVDSLEFFGIDKSKQNEYFLIDVRTNLMHNLHSYVRDYYSFKRSQHPQLQLINMNPNQAFDILQRQELVNQFMEFGKVLMSLSIVKSSHMAVQRALFLHEELMKLPTFPRKALETNFSLFRGPLGHQVFSMDRIHKICWVRVIARMFELTSGFFLQLGDIQLFLNAISGIFVLHCEEASVSRLCLATFINATHQFKSIFATDGFMPIMSTIVQVYSNHQSNQLLCRSIEFICKQFYITHRKPFLLQLFGSVASKLNTAEILQHNAFTSPVGLYQYSNQQQQQQHQQAQGSTSSANSSVSQSTSNQLSATTTTTCYAATFSDPNRISPTAFFRLLISLEKAFKDPLDILELVDAEKPLRAVDFCYQQDKESIEILDIISLCVTVTAYASESPRSTQMLIILESVVPLYMKHLQASTSKKAGQSMGKQAHKEELQKIQSISICIRTLIVNCEGLTRNFNGPLASFDFRSSSIRRAASGTQASGSSRRAAQQAAGPNNSAGSPLDIYAEEPSLTGPETSQAGTRGQKSNADSVSGKQTTFAAGSTGRPANLGGGVRSNATGSGFNNDESEITRGEFIVPRDTLLNLVAEFLSLSTGRLMESQKKYVDLHQKHSSYELLDVKSHLRLAEVANSLLKFASTDPSVMACRGLIRYMNEILPNTEWRQEAIRPALIMILKRLDKTFNRIAKKNWVKRSTDWEAAKQLLKGAYLTFIKHPYIVHLPHLKSLISCCQNIILSDGLQSSSALTSNLLHGFAPSAAVGSVVASQQQQQQKPQPLMPQQPSTSGSVVSPAVSKFQASASNLLAVNHSRTKTVSPSSSSGGNATGGSGGGLQTGTPSLAAVTAAAALAERLASGAAGVNSTHQITSQGFNSVTIRLIAMQLLQMGDSQTLESFIGNSMNTPEKLESLMLNLIYPMCIRCCSGAREAPKMRPCDIMYILNIVLQMLAPQSASSKSCSSFANSPKTATDTSQFILSKITTTIGSTQTGATALNIVAGGSAAHSPGNAHQLVQHQEALKIGFLGLKILCVCFESQLASEWVRISRLIRDLALQSEQPSNPLWDFLDFVVTYRFPMFVLLLPTIKCDISRRIRQLERHRQTASSNQDEQQPQQPVIVSSTTLDQIAHYRQNLCMIEAKIHGSTPTVFRSKSFLFVSLTAELRMLKEQLIAKRKLLLDGERNHHNNSHHHHHLSLQTHSSGSTGANSGGHQSGSTAAGGLDAQGQPSTSGGLNSASSETGDHFGGAYHRLSAAIASFANQSQMGKMSPSTSGVGSTQLGTSAALKGAACFAAQLATSTPISSQVLGSPSAEQHVTTSGGGGSSQSSIRLSTAKSREEARKMMNTILRRTSYPHNQSPGQQKSAASSHQTGSDSVSTMAGSDARKGSQPASPSMSQARQAPLAEIDMEAGESSPSQQIIMDPAMLIKAAFPAAPRKSTTEGTGILKQLVQTIDRQNVQRQRQQTQRHQRTYRPTSQDQKAHHSTSQR